MAQLLIKRGANVDFVGPNGTALHLAFVNGDMKMVDLLLSNRATVNVTRPCDKKTMLHLFIDELLHRSDGHWSFPLLDIPDIIYKNMEYQDVYLRKLVELGCEVNAKDEEGNTALHIACTKLRDGEGCARIVLELGANINIENDEGETPFHRSLYYDGYRINADDFMMLYHHVQKLKALGLEVNPNNEKCCAQLLSEKEECDPEAECFTEESLAKMQQQRLDEIEKMQKTKIDRRTTLYKVLLEKSAILGEYSRNDKFRKIIDAENFSDEYPSYGFMLKLQDERGQKIAEAHDKK
ncbi:85/88 kDa calcium-independent phospholipase A2-like [Nasonia vitripennis]|uniref:Uncharacterized protein n=1 Tax=Nasonia vitripennis TaxID=7425 RepID=A0A7M7LRU5_NASVI|nr:85/88 kDa calcium-independent phospholipase A2-like [Nasonia vitripennis]